MATKAGAPEVGTALKGIYNSTIRNAVYHSDYAIHNDSLRLLSGSQYSKKEGVYTSLITFDEARRGNKRSIRISFRAAGAMEAATKAIHRLSRKDSALR